MKTNIQYSPTMQLTAHERSEWQRFAAALYARDINVIASEVNVLACLAWPIPLHDFDRIAAMFRAWLVFGEFPISA